MEKLQKELARWTKKSDAEIARIFEDAGIKTLEYDNAFYTMRGLEPIELFTRAAVSGSAPAGTHTGAVRHVPRSGGMLRLLEDASTRTEGEVRKLYPHHG